MEHEELYKPPKPTGWVSPSEMVFRTQPQYNNTTGQQYYNTGQEYHNTGQGQYPTYQTNGSIGQQEQQQCPYPTNGSIGTQQYSLYPATGPPPPEQVIHTQDPTIYQPNDLYPPTTGENTVVIIDGYTQQQRQQPDRKQCCVSTICALCLCCLLD